MINLNDFINGSKYFKWKEALYLPQWDTYHRPSDIEIVNIIKVCNKMNLIREFLGVPINVHCWIRPILNNPNSIHAGMDYNSLVSGAPHSEHKIGCAVDWDAQDLNCDDVRTKLLPKLEEWEIRVENKPKSLWVHVDTKSTPLNGNRFFIP